MNWYKYSQNSGLKQKLLSLRQQFALAAQNVYNEWEQDDEGMDDMLGAGGICQDIAEAICGILANNNIDCYTADSGGMGEQHVWAIAYNKREAYEVDIDFNLYETGSGYSWTKKPNVVFQIEDVSVFPFDRKQLEEALNEGY